MASVQCNNKPSDETTCQQKCQGSGSLGQKVSNWVKGNHHGQPQPKPNCPAQAQAQAQPRSCPSKAQTPKPLSQRSGAGKASGGPHHSHRHSHSKHHAAANGVTCHSACKTSGSRHGHGDRNSVANGCAATCHGKPAVSEQRKERNLFTRIKDRISGNNSCSDGSSSDSDNDHECCHKRN